MLYYLSTVNKYLGKYHIFSPEEVIDGDYLETIWQQFQPHYSFYQLLEIFPMAKPDIKRSLLAKINQCQQNLVRAEEVRIDYNNKVLNRVNYEDKWFWSMIRDMIYVEPLTEGREATIKKCRFRLSALKPRVIPGRITEADIARAKETPLTDFLEVNHAGFARCPFHEDKTPSLKVYQNTNRWFCFSCNAGTDVVDFIQKRYGCDFITAVKKLL